MEGDVSSPSQYHANEVKVALKRLQDEIDNVILLDEIQIPNFVFNAKKIAEGFEGRNLRSPEDFVSLASLKRQLAQSFLYLLRKQRIVLTSQSFHELMKERTARIRPKVAIRQQMMDAFWIWVKMSSSARVRNLRAAYLKFRKLLEEAEKLNHEPASVQSHVPPSHSVSQ
ncbi:MAG: hypothetical protein JWL80_520 [Parcubacteria group bacterium]|nr:hypothetical protein [Parcubacteria group bacterium]